MKKYGIFFAMLVVTIAVAFAQLEPSTLCVPVSSTGDEFKPAEVRTSKLKFDSKNGKLTFTLENRLRTAYLDLLYVEIEGRIGPNNNVPRTVKISVNDERFRWPKDFDGYIPQRGKVEIDIRDLKEFASVSKVTVVTQVCAL